MNNQSSQDQHCFTTNEWWSTKTDRVALWKNFLFHKVIVSWELEYWFYWMAYFMEPDLKNIITALEKAPTKDIRYLDQIQQMATYVKDFLFKCRCVLTAQRSRCFYTSSDMGFPCQTYSVRFTCYCFRQHMTQVGCLKMCDNAKFALFEDVMEVIKALMVEWLYEYYYVWKMKNQGRLHFPVDVNIHPMSLSDIRLWEVVCEDDDKQILCHPFLPHPTDFLEKHVVNKTSILYVDKARFEYEIPGTLSKYPIVLSKKPSIIPRMIPALIYQKEEEPIRCEGNRQVLYTESTTAHKNERQHKKRRLSKILKEGRKKNKTQRIRRRLAENCLRQSFPIEDYYSDDDDNWNEDSSYDDYDRYNDYDYSEWW